MVKARPVIVVSPKLRTRTGLCTVVPLSTTEPRPEEEYHMRLRLSRKLPHPWNSEEHWVKADMIGTVSYERLSPIKLGRDQYGNRKYLNFQIDPEGLKEIRKCVLIALGMEDLTWSL